MRREAPTQSVSAPPLPDPSALTDPRLDAGRGIDQPSVLEGTYCSFQGG
jgi:hypothetical protein